MEKTNVPILHRIWIRFQGASMGACLLYAPIDATRKMDSKTSRMGTFVSSTSLGYLVVDCSGRTAATENVYRIPITKGTASLSKSCYVWLSKKVSGKVTGRPITIMPFQMSSGIRILHNWHKHHQGHDGGFIFFPIVTQFDRRWQSACARASDSH